MKPSTMAIYQKKYLYPGRRWIQYFTAACGPSAPIPINGACSWGHGRCLPQPAPSKSSRGVSPYCTINIMGDLKMATAPNPQQSFFWCDGKLLLFILFLLFPFPLLLAWTNLNLLFQINILSRFQQSNNESFVTIKCCMVTT